MLFEAINGELFPGGFADEAIRETLKMCLSCKSCKSECSATVDMAIYKAEFLHHYYRSIRPLRAKLVGQYLRMGAAGREASRALNFRLSPLGSVAKSALGVHAQRTLPRFAARSFRQWFAAHTRTQRGTGSRALYRHLQQLLRSRGCHRRRRGARTRRLQGGDALALRLLRTPALRSGHARRSQAATGEGHARAALRTSNAARPSSDWSRAASSPSATNCPASIRTIRCAGVVAPVVHVRRVHKPRSFRRSRHPRDTQRRCSRDTAIIAPSWAWKPKSICCAASRD